MGNQLAQEQAQLKNLNFSEKELQKLYKNFSKIDRDKSGTLEPSEFFEIPGKSPPRHSLRHESNRILACRAGEQPLG